MTDALAAAGNLGPRSAAALAAAGITSLDQLRALGPVAAYLAVKQNASATGFKPSLNLLWALAGAIEQRPWQDVARHDRLRLLTALEEATRTP